MLVGFLGGDIDRPVVMGAVYSQGRQGTVARSALKALP